MARGLPSLIIDVASAIPVYRQITDSIRTLLVNGDLQPGDMLPSVREIALGLGVHFNTVAEAYRTLGEEGWLEVKRGRGAVVLDRSRTRIVAHPDEKAAFSRRVRDLLAEVQSKGLQPKFLARELRLLAEGLDND